ncbi:MAG: branched-chain amino acid ABC transporter permease [Nitrospinota bacterium]
MATATEVRRRAPIKTQVGLGVRAIEFLLRYGILVVGALLVLAPFILNGITSLALYAEDEGWAAAPLIRGIQNTLPNVPLMIQIMVYALYGIAFNIALGYTGVLSLGHCAFFGIGGYAAGLLFAWFKQGTPVPAGLTQFFLGFPMEYALLATVVSTFLVALGMGFLCQRKLGVYFAILTLAISQVFYYAAQTFDDLTGGTDGLGGLENIRLGTLGLRLGVVDAQKTYWFVLITSAVCVFLIWQILRSPYGQVLRAIKENEERARACGYNTQRIKLTAFVVSGVFSGIAGYLAIVYGESVPIENIHWSNSGTVVIISLFGGTGVFLGPAVGSFIYWYLRQLMSTQFVTFWQGFEYWEAWVGGIFVLIVLFLPEGILGTLRKLALNYRAKRYQAVSEGLEQAAEAAPVAPAVEGARAPDRGAP